MALTIRLPAKVRLSLAAAVVAGLSSALAAIAFGWLGQSAAVPEPEPGVIAAHARLAGFSTERLTSELTGKYGFHFRGPAATADPGSVDMATSRDHAGDLLRVIVFGRAPEPVHGLVCEFTPAGAAGTATTATTPDGASAPAAAQFLAACAKLGAGTAQADAAVHWVAQAQAGLDTAAAIHTDRGRLTAATKFATVGYVVRRLPETGEWIMVMSGENP